MKMTKALKEWLVVQKGLSADASQEQLRKAAADAFMDGELTHENYVALTKDPDADRASALERKLDSLNARLENAEKGISRDETPAALAISNAPRLDKEFAAGMAGSTGTDTRTRVEVKSVKDMYSQERREARYPEKSMRGGRHVKAGERVWEGDPTTARRQVNEPSQLDMAMNGAYFKWKIFLEKGCTNYGTPKCLQFTEHDKSLIDVALHECEWGGVIGGVGTEDEGAIGVKGTKLTDFQRKAVLDSATSGGLELAPIMFDDAVILTPILHSEFYQRVNTVPVTRGRRIEGGTIGNVTLSSGGADGTDIPIFNTSAFIAAFDTSIFVCNGSIELGLDFLSESPVDVAAIVTEQYGRVLLNWLDEQVCIGDGTTEPEGVLNASGTVTVSATNTSVGPPTVGDYEGLLFAVTKKYKQGFAADRLTFAGTETSYKRARGIAVSTSDQRRVFGMDHESYQLLGHPYGIGEFFTNRQILFVNWGRYRMYRRMGLTIQTTTAGKTLVRLNQMLISARARFGGRIEAGAAAGVTTDAQT